MMKIAVLLGMITSSAILKLFRYFNNSNNATSNIIRTKAVAMVIYADNTFRVLLLSWFQFFRVQVSQFRASKFEPKALPRNNP